MLVVSPGCFEQLGKAFLRALERGAEESLISQLKYFDGYSSPPGEKHYSKCELYPDSDALSFYFVMYGAVLSECDDPEENGYRKVKTDPEGNVLYQDKPWFNGGLIFHPGTGVPGISDGTHSVELTPEDGPHWSVHT